MSRDALRRGRYSAPGQLYHVTSCTKNRQPLFSDPAFARLAIGQMRVLNDAAWVYTLAWVLMPDHLHWLFELGEQRSLDQVLKCFKGRSGQLLSRALQRPGSVWQPGYHDHALRYEEDVQAIARYIVANPLRARLMERIGDYPWWDAVWL
ncbi:REP-associated tyrosine transposase [Stutzerimonas nitrititolerans]|uniref:REP-associated tyrosine transposase n=1 Tax=Stutzerimonas nitrititolerans TaxID=2482751 RepID=UPI0028A9439F|nr:transposase [Stutzerimonas nitrititolerans]